MGVPGFVYLMKIDLKSRGITDCYKIGSTTNIKNRVSAVSSEWCESVSLVHSIYTADTLTIEKKIQHIFNYFQWQQPLDIPVWHYEYFLFDSNILPTVMKTMSKWDMA